MTDDRSPALELDCSDCGRAYLGQEGACCPFCAARARREAEAAATAADRARLGFAPSTKAVNLTRIAVDAGLHWLRLAARYGDDDRGGWRIERAMRLLARAREELE